MKSLRIYILGPAYPLRGGGITTFNELLCGQLIKDGHDAQIISYKLQYPSFLFPGSSQFDYNAPKPEGIQIHSLINSINPFNWFFVAKFIKRRNPDLLIIRFWIPFMAPALGTICRLIGSHTKIIALTDNIIPHENRIGDKLFTKYLLKKCDGFITMSASVMEDLKKFTNSIFKKQLRHPLYNGFGIAPTKFSAREFLGINQEDKVVLFFGLIRKYKGLDILLEAFARPEIKKSNIKLLIAGEFYDDKAYYLDIIRKNNLENSIILHDRFIKNEEVKYYFGASNLVALPYRNATQSGVTQVALHFEKPVLVTNVGGLAEVIPHQQCGYVSEINSKKIAEYINDYFENNKEEMFSANMKQEKEKYSWEIFTREIYLLYKELADDNTK